MLVTTLAYKTNLKNGLSMQPLNVAFMAGDDDAHRFEVRCFYGDEPVELIGSGITGYFVRHADGATLPIAGNVEDNAAVVVLPAACYAVPGRFSFVIKVTSATVIQSVLWVDGVVSRSHTDSVVDPGESVPSLDELLAKIDAIDRVTTRAERVANMTAKAQTLPAGYDATAHYDKETGVLTIGVPLSKVEGGGTGGGMPGINETLMYDAEGDLGVNVTDEIAENNRLPVSSAAVYTTVGNINVLLETI